MSRRLDAFPRAPRRRKGYSRKQVDRLLATADATLGGGSPRLSAGDIRRAGFELVRRGYDVTAVDAALDDLEERVLALSTGAKDASVRVAAERELTALGKELSVGERQFARVARYRRGHSVAEVDLLFGRMCRPQLPGAEVTVEELRQATFSPQRGGYDQDAVDRTLDRVIELMLVARLVDVSEPTERPRAPHGQALRLVVPQDFRGRTT